jgi:hypothetical protein
MPNYEVTAVLHVKFYVTADNEAQAENKVGQVDWTDHIRDHEVTEIRQVGG